MNTPIRIQLGPVEKGVALPPRRDGKLTTEQAMVMRLKDGESFTLRAIRDDDETQRQASKVAARLSVWAGGRRIKLSYRMIDKEKDTVRVMRIGAFDSLAGKGAIR